jgi:hypothetical protein
MGLRALAVACALGLARAHTEPVQSIDAGADTVTLQNADPGITVGTQVSLASAAGQTCASAVATPLTVTGVDGAVVSVAAAGQSYITASDDAASTNCVLIRAVSPAPGAVPADGIFFTKVDEGSFQINWKAPTNLGDYNAEILGYDVQIAEVCELSDTEQLVYANQVATHLRSFDLQVANVAMTALNPDHSDAYAAAIVSGGTVTDAHGVNAGALSTGDEMLSRSGAAGGGGNREIGAWGDGTGTAGGTAGAYRELGPWGQTRRVSYMEHTTIPGAHSGTGNLATAISQYGAATSHGIYENVVTEGCTSTLVAAPNTVTEEDTTLCVLTSGSPGSCAPDGTANAGSGVATCAYVAASAERGLGWAEDALLASPTMECAYDETTGSYEARDGASNCALPGSNGDARVVVDTASGKTLAQSLPSNPSTTACTGSTWAAGDPVASADVGSARSGWTSLTGVYTPTGGQDHSKPCVDDCATTACGAGSLTDPIASCGGCYPKDTSETGCFPGASGYPTAPHDSSGIGSHTTHVSAGGYYVVRVRAYNQFGTGPYGPASYAVQLATAPTAPQNLAMAATSASDTAYSLSPTAVTINWEAPDNFATGTDDCAGAATVAATTVEQLRCAMKSTADIAQDCGLSGTFVDADALDCLDKSDAAGDGWDGYYDCAYDSSTDTISPFSCATNGYGASSVGAAKCAAATVALDACEAITPTSQLDCAAAGVGCVINAAGSACVAGQAFCDAQTTGCTFAGGDCVPTQYYTLYESTLGVVATNLDSPTYAVTGLTADTTYTFTAKMTNAVGEGPASQALVVKTPPVPSAPMEPFVSQAASGTSSASFDLDWSLARAQVETKSPVTGYRLWAQSKDGLSLAVDEDCTATDPSNSGDVATCDAVTNDGTSATCESGNPCTYTAARAAGSTAWQPAARMIGNLVSSPADVSFSFEDDDINAAPTATVNGVDALEVSSGSIVNGVTVTNLRQSTEYRFAIQFVSAAGDGAVSPWSGSVTTLEQPVSDLRIMSGAPCVYETPQSTTFAASAAGTNVQYRWELVYRDDAGIGALNNDATAGANNFQATAICVATDAQLCADITDEDVCGTAADRGGISPAECTWDSTSSTCKATDDAACAAITTNEADCTACAACTASGCTFHNALAAGDTPGVMSGSTIASVGSSNCKNDACSVMDYTIPLPGFDDAVPHYDEMEIRVVAYNSRGMVRKSVAFGWAPGDPATQDYQTIEYCGCTEPSASNYWQLATYNLPATCTGVESWDSSSPHTAAGHMLSTVLKDEFEYYQFHYDHTTTAVEVTVRLDSGAVDVYVGSDGVATPSQTSTYTTSETSVTNHYVVTIPYTELAGSNSLYITIKGAGGGAFAHYQVLAQAKTFRSYSCDVDATGSEHCTGGEGNDVTSQETIFRDVLQEGVAIADKVLPTYYYHFYEFNYPRADNDIDLELSVECSAGQVTVYASTTERYPSNERAVSGSGGFWAGSSHTATVAAGSSAKLMYTLRPQTSDNRHHTDDTQTSGHGGRVYFGVKGTVAHSAGDFLPSSTYSITAKVFRYRVESELLDLEGGLTEDRRYSVVTEDNFNYYEVRLTPSTYQVQVKITVHYGEVDLYRSSTTLPTQDSSAISDGGGADAAAVTINPASSLHTETIPASGLNLVDGYVYFGLIGRTPESAYELEVELSELNNAAAPTPLYNCGGGIVSVDSSCKDASDVALAASDFGSALSTLAVGTTYFFKFHISEYENVDMSVTQRSGAGTPVADGDRATTSADTWGTDWTETLTSTWVDDFTDELDLDVNVALDLPSAANVYMSISDPYPSAERLSTALTLDGSHDGQLDNIATFQRTWVYLSVTPTGAAMTSPAQIRVTPVENVPATASSETTAAAVCQANSCNNHGSCISDPPSPIYCICDDGYYDGPSGYCSVSAATTAGSTVSLDAVFKDTSGSTLCSNQAAACSIAEISPSLSSSVTGKVAGLYDAATETVVLDCSVDDCTPRGTSGKVGYVTCTNVGTSCTLLVPAPMMSVSMDVTGADTPAYSKLRAYVDGKPYPRAGANTFVQSASGAYSTDLKVYSLTPGVEHTLSLVLTTDDGAPLAIKSRAFTVDFQGGCDNSCSNQGVCHSGYCVCFDGWYGTDCSTTVADVTADITVASTFGASTAYRLRNDALNAEKLAATRFVHKVHLEETTSELARSQAALTTKNQATSTKLENDVLTSGSTLKTALANDKSAIEANVANVYKKQERNTIQIQQAKQESARLKTANQEAFIDHKRSLFAHQTAVQNANDAALLAVQQQIAEKNAAIQDNFREGRFIKNQLRTANGPRTAVDDLTTQSCTTDQFFGTSCEDVDYADADFAAGARNDAARAAAAAVDAAVAAERDGSTVPR